MMLSRVCRSANSLQIASYLKVSLIPKSNNVSRLYTSDARTGFKKATRTRPTLAERAMAPAGNTAAHIGKGALAGAAVIGIGSLCYYGAGLSSAEGAIDRSILWPQYVKDRIQTTYMYFGGSIAATAATALMCLRIAGPQAILKMAHRAGMVGFFVSIAAMIGTGMLARSIPYKEGFGQKQMAWLLHTSVMGAILAPVTLYGGPIILRAALYTAGIIGGLSAVAVCAPSEKFLNMSGPLAIGLGVVFTSAIGSMYLPPTTVLGSGFHAIALYGGLVLFSMFLLYDTQKIIKNAETQPISYNRNIQGQVFTSDTYDPINHSISIYVDSLNIFLNMLRLLSGSGKRN